MSEMIDYLYKNAANARFLLIGDHAGNRLPASVPQALHLPQEEMERHIAWDIGVDGVMRHMAAFSEAPSVLARYSRLWVDLNRAPEEQDCIRLMYDGTQIPFNIGLSTEKRAERLAHYFTPYHQAIAEMVTVHANALPVLVHSFTPALRDDPQPRPWEIAVLWREDEATAQKAMAWLRANTSYCIGDNEPYSLFKHSCYTAELHFYEKKKPHLILEVRQDLIATDGQQRQMAELLVKMINALV